MKPTKLNTPTLKTVNKPNNNFIVEGVHSKNMFIVADIHNEPNTFALLISLDSDVKNRVERWSKVNDKSEYRKLDKGEAIKIYND